MLTVFLRLRVLVGVLLAALLVMPSPAVAKTPVKYLFVRQQQPAQQQPAEPLFARQQAAANEEADEAEDETPPPTVVVAPTPAAPVVAPMAKTAPVLAPAAPAAAPAATAQPAIVAPAPQQIQAVAPAQSPQEATAAYKLGSGDRLRITVFGEPDLSGEFEVDSVGKISMPLVGQVNVSNLTVSQTTATLVQILSGGYLRDPKVNIDVMNYRPFFILGEVLKPGSYPYVNGMTIVNAVAMAGGYTYRADDGSITVVRAGDPAKKEHKIGETDQIMPGDVVRVPERFF